jgi:hypothetical protein
VTIRKTPRLTGVALIESRADGTKIWSKAVHVHRVRYDGKRTASCFVQHSILAISVNEGRHMDKYAPDNDVNEKIQLVGKHSWSDEQAMSSSIVRGPPTVSPFPKRDGQ